MNLALTVLYTKYSLDSGYARRKGVGCPRVSQIRGVGCRVQGVGSCFGVEGIGFRVEGLGFIQV